MEVLDNLSPQDRELVEEIIENQTEKAVQEEREAIVEYIRSRVGFWTSNSNVNKPIERIARHIEEEAHIRIKADGQT